MRPRPPQEVVWMMQLQVRCNALIHSLVVYRHIWRCVRLCTLKPNANRAVMHHSHSLQFHSTITPLGVYSTTTSAGLWLQRCGCTRLTSSEEIWSSLNCHGCPKQQTATVFPASASQWMRWGLSGADLSLIKQSLLRCHSNIYILSSLTWNTFGYSYLLSFVTVKSDRHLVWWHGFKLYTLLDGWTLGTGPRTRKGNDP